MKEMEKEGIEVRKEWRIKGKRKKKGGLEVEKKFMEMKDKKKEEV